MTMTTTFRPDAPAADLSQTALNSGFSKIEPRKSDYMIAVEKANNPNVGPGSYDPTFKANFSTTHNTDWSRAPPRFKEAPLNNDPSQ